MCVQLQTLPEVKVFRYSKPLESEGNSVQFRLFYKGPLPSQSGGGNPGIIREKHAIRKQFHSQLRELWGQHQVLRQRWITPPGYDGPTTVQKAIQRYQCYGFNWLPLIADEWGVACSLDILFLRRDNPGNVIRSGGDIDNRLKVLFDAFRKPHDANEVRGQSPEEGEDPFFCLLEDDSLINEVKVTTDRLLLPQAESEHIHDVLLVIEVKTIVTDIYRAEVESWI